MNGRENMDASVQRLNDLRGLMAIWIVLGHLALSMDSQRNIFLLMQKGDLAIVGLFFFLSGYGLEKSFEKKQDYLRGFLFKKTARLLLMTWVQFGVTELCLYLVKFPRDYKGITGILSEYATNLNWYMWELALMYLIFFVSHLLFKNKKASYVTAAILTVALLVALYALQGSFASTYSCLAFPAGMIIYKVKHKFEKACVSRYGEMFVGLLILTGVSTSAMLIPKEFFASVLVKNIFCVCFVTFMAVIFLRLDSQKESFKVLAKFSPEIYLYQFPAASVTMAIACRERMPRGLKYAAVTFVLTMVMAVIMYALRRAFERMISDGN